MDTRKSPSSSSDAIGLSFDTKSFEQVKEILHHLANTVSALKIFPLEHATAVGFVEGLTDKLKGFLEEHGKLEIGVEEYSFTFGGRPAYSDPMTIKSLPFFFFKDGLQILFFYQGLDRAEIADLLELIRRESQKAAEDADIVTAMWERDFANIQYFAPDDYVENRILEERSESQSRRSLSTLPAEFAQETIEVKVDTSKFSRGKIELTEEDRAAIKKGPDIMGATQGEHVGPAGLEGQSDEPRESGRSPAAAMDPDLSVSEIQALESLLRANRTISPDEEFLNLMVEVLFLEKDINHFSSDLDVLLDYQADKLQRGDFAVAVLLVHKLRELRDYLATASPPKARQLDIFMKEVASSKTLDAVRTFITEKKTVAWRELVDFFRLLGPTAFPLVAGIYESIADPEMRLGVIELFREAAAKEPAVLIGLAADERPLFAKEIIGLLAKEAGKKAAPYFSAFVGFKDKTIKLAAIEALGGYGDEMSNRILLGFLKDPDEDVRIQAAMGLNPVEEKSRIRTIVKEAKSRDFFRKSLKEKQAVLSFLGRTRTEEALIFLRRTLERRNFFRSSGSTAMRLAAVAGLESMGTPEARAALEKGAASGNKAVREACAQALGRLVQAPPGRSEQ